MFAIGPISPRNRVALAPMAGVTDAPFRELAWQAGAGYIVAEMTSAKPILWNTLKSRARRRHISGDAPHIVQIAGSEPAILADAARRNWQAGADVIDINFGCPAKKVCRKAAGSALLAQPERVKELVSNVVAAVPVPVTVKMRTGPSPQQRNAAGLARQLEDLGVQAIAVHGRTRACKFVGAVEYDTIAAVKAAVRIPVWANGDITGVEAARAVLSATGADGIMVGRAALGAPWLPGAIAQALANGASCDTRWWPSLPARLAQLHEHVQGLHAFYGAVQGMRIARKHAQWCLGHASLAEQERLILQPFASAVVRIKDASEQLDFLASLPTSQALAACV